MIILNFDKDLPRSLANKNYQQKKKVNAKLKNLKKCCTQPGTNKKNFGYKKIGEPFAKFFISFLSLHANL